MHLILKTINWEWERFVKEQEKVQLLRTILTVTVIMLGISVIIKLMGFNFFGLELENQVLNAVSDFLGNNTMFNDLIGLICLYINYFIFYRLCCENSDSKIYHMFAINIALINMIIQMNVLNYGGDSTGLFYLVLSIATLIIPCWCIDKKFKLKKPFTNLFLILIYQELVTFLSSTAFQEEFQPLYSFLLNFDFIILLTITYYLHLKMRGSDYKCLVEEHQNGAFLSSVLKTSLQRLQENFQSFSNKNRQEKAEVIIYIILSVLWECFTLGMLLLVAILNHTVIECLFILTSFLITKTTFGTPFHFRSAWACFIVSNLTYYMLNRVTLSINISFVVPITLGILLSYVTSKFVKKANRKLYRGIPKDELLEICKDLTKLEQNILMDFYSNRYNSVALSIKYHYSEKSIYNHKRAALDKLKEQSK